MPSSERIARRGLLALPLLLGACAGLPQPFRGNPGTVARRLAQPPGYRIAVPPPEAALLPDAEAGLLARAMAEALKAQEVPAVAEEGLPLDWVLDIAAERQGASVLPRFALRDADGRLLGQLSGRAVPARDWAAGSEAVLRASATEAAPRLAELVARVDATRRTGDERASGRVVPVVRLLPVRGAPGDGNRSLTARMAERMAALGLLVQEQAEGADFAVQGRVDMARAGRGLQRVEIVWVVSRRDGEDLGRVLQLNEVPAGSLDGLWADVAFVVAEEAAGGVRQVIANAGGLPAAPAPAAAQPAVAPAAAPATPARGAPARPRGRAR